MNLELLMLINYIMQGASSFYGKNFNDQTTSVESDDDSPGPWKIPEIGKPGIHSLIFQGRGGKLGSLNRSIKKKLFL